jgi:putative chitinase
MKLTVDQLSQMIPTNKEALEWCNALNDLFPKYEIITPQRIAGFVSQCAHESMDFRVLEENLNYKEATLLRVFPRYFGAGKANAAEYAGNPQKIANYVYMDKNRSKGGALGNCEENDGYFFRGKGLKQVTGRSNHAAFGKTLGMTAEQAAEYLLTKQGAVESALWFWDSRNLNAIADTDTGDVVKLTKVINGGNIGLADRQARYSKAISVLTGSAPTSSRNASTKSLQTLRKGSTGDLVKRVQLALNITADGDFGPATESAVKAWQKKIGLTPDGIIGPKSLQKLFG